MAHRFYKFPPLATLVAFEAAARHRSFKQAANELNVTPGAISHQVKALEKDIGGDLFHRGHRVVDLTEEGLILFGALQHSFTNISEALISLKNKTQDSPVVITSTTAVSSLWLTPRLTAFWSKYASVPINQIVSDDPGKTPVNFDLQIRYGRFHSGKKASYEIFRDDLVPLCHPSVIEKAPSPSLEDIAQQTLIHLDAEDRNWTTWDTWFRELGYDGNINRGRNFNNYSIALQAAQDGIGIVLGWRRLSAPLIREGKLVPWGGHHKEAPNGFHIICDQDDRLSQNARLLKNWLLAHPSDDVH